MAIIEAEMQPATTAMQAGFDVEPLPRAGKELSKEAAQASKGFDYSQIDEGIRDEVQQAARSIHQLSAGVVTGIVAIGKRLIEVKGMLPHGQFEAWVEGEFGMKPRMAQNMMSVAREFDSPEKRKTYALFTPSVLYMLAAPSTPDEARAEIEQAAAAGKAITVEFAKEAVRKHRPDLEAVRYSPDRVLDNMIWEFVYAYASESSRTPEDVLEFVATAETTRADKLRERMARWLHERGVEWRIGALPQAVKRVREQRRQRDLQAQARTVYVEPEPVRAEPDPLPMTTRDDAPASYLPESERVEIDDAELRMAGFHLVHSSDGHHDMWSFWWARFDDAPQFGPQRMTAELAIDDARRCFAEFHAPAPKLTPLEQRERGMTIITALISRETDTTSTGPGGLHDAVSRATAEQLTEALELLPDELRKGRGPVLRERLRKLGVIAPLQVAEKHKPGPATIEPDLLADLSGVKMLLSEVIDAVPHDPVIRAYVDNVRRPLNILIDALSVKGDDQ